MSVKETLKDLIDEVEALDDYEYCIEHSHASIYYDRKRNVKENYLINLVCWIRIAFEAGFGDGQEAAAVKLFAAMNNWPKDKPFEHPTDVPTEYGKDIEHLFYRHCCSKYARFFPGWLREEGPEGRYTALIEEAIAIAMSDPFSTRTR